MMSHCSCDFPTPGSPVLMVCAPRGIRFCHNQSVACNNLRGAVPALGVNARGCSSIREGGAIDENG
jgi:hypothetical protein